MEDLFKISLYLYDSSQANGLGTEIPNVLIGGKITTCLDDTLDTAEVTIDLSDRKETYKPLTKMVLVLSKGNDTKYFHYEVRSDLVEKLSMSDDKYKHTLFLGNPAISCQKRTCDNFSISYRLQDVTLEADKFSDSLVVNPEIQSAVASGIYYLLNPNYELVDTYTTSGTIITTAVIQRISKVFDWAQYDWDFTFKITTYEGWGKTDYRLANTTYFKTNLENMSYYSIYDKADDGLTQEDIDRLNKWMNTYHKDKKLQVINYQSGKDYSTEIGGSKISYFEENPAISGTTMSFVVPQLLSYNSIANQGDTDVDIDINDYVMLPTLTTIKKTNKTTGYITYNYYVSAYGSQNTTVSAKEYYQSRRNSSSPTYAMVKSGYTGDVYYANNSFITSASNSAIIASKFNFKNRTTGLTDVAYSPVYLNAYGTFDKCNNIITFNVEPNTVYEITVEGYFGEQNRPMAYQGPTIERNGVYIPTKYDASTQISFTPELESITNEVESNTIVCSEYTRLIYNAVSGKYTEEYKCTKAKGTDFKWSVAFETIDVELGATNKILKQYSTKPTCYDLFLKAQICSQTKTFDENDKWSELPNKLPYTSDFEKEMKEKTIIEDTYQNKNLWEIFMQIGKYLHAKPYIEFSGDRYNLSFKEYGSIEQHTDKATKDTLFNSYDIESYISSLDNYIENYFEYGNEVEEILRPTDNDGTSVCSTDNAVFKTKYAIMEIVSLSLIKNRVAYDMTSFVYEHNIYKLLPILSTDATSTGLDAYYSHYRGNSIYYHKYGTQIMGLQYKEPSTNNDKPYAIKQAIFTILANNSALGGITEASKIHINDYMFKIVYRTRDDARFKNFKPDLRKFIRNADNDLYPVQTQFNNQLDKIVDSAKYGNNVYGTLLRSGNEQLNYTEHIEDLTSIKDSGDLYNVNDNLYYVTKNTMVIYPNAVMCEVEYSKDYNKLSEIIGIDSEPRFYEIAEDKTIKRNVAIDNFFLISDKQNGEGIKLPNQYDTEILWYMASDSYYKYQQPKYVITKFSNVGSNDETKDFSKTVVTPCICYASGSTLTIEWDMQDNFGAGEYQKDVSSEYASMYKNSSYMAQIFSTFGISYSSTGETTFTTARSVQYCDVFGKCDIMNFFFLPGGASFWKLDTFGKSMPEIDTSAFPYTEYVMDAIGSYVPSSDYYSYEGTTNFTTKNVGYVINKDARETIGVNVSYHLITDSDRIIVANGVWRSKLKEDGTGVSFYIAALQDEVSKFSKDTILNQVIEFKQIDLATKTANTFILNFIPSLLSDDAITNAKAIAIIYNVQTLYQFNFVIARNVDGLTLEEKKKQLYITRITSKDYFKTKED